MTVEHLETQSAHPELANIYSNCVYACRPCNQARNAKPSIDKEGRKLLNPCTDVWSEHFTLENNRLIPKPGDRDAEYTEWAYQLNSPGKIARRHFRHRLIADRLQLSIDLSGALSRLRRALLHYLQKGHLGAEETLRQIKTARQAAERALVDLERYRAIPFGAGRRCGCHKKLLGLPRWLERQVLTIDRPHS